MNGTIVYVLLSSRTVMLLATMILGQELFVNMIGDMGHIDDVCSIECLCGVTCRNIGIQF